MQATPFGDGSASSALLGGLYILMLRISRHIHMVDVMDSFVVGKTKAASQE